MQASAPSRWRRVPAYAADYLVIAAIAAAIAGVNLLTGGFEDGFDGRSRLSMYLFATLSFTAPVVLLYALMEGVFSTTPGKALAGLRVRTAPGARPGLPRALVRNLVKFAPWEIAHLGVWITPGTPFVSPPGIESLILWNAALALTAGQALLILVTGRGVHDRLAGTLVSRMAPKRASAD
ncbi:MAG: RDD family protein [Maricaulaceae bacterium]|nr:RDD family protein [Maricaulaceae bacterium]